MPICFTNNDQPLLIGMIHLEPLPGSPSWGSKNMQYIIKQAVDEARIMNRAGMDAIIIENMHDRPYLRGYVKHETSSAMAITGYAIKQAVGDFPVGIQILAGANREALGTAVSAELDFLRVEGFAYAHIADEGMIEACAGELLRARKELNAENIKIFADIQKKHSSHAMTSDMSIDDWAYGASFCLADALIITGKSTGTAPDKNLILRAKASSSLPIIVGSGLTLENISTYIKADAFIVGSSLKEDGKWYNKLDQRTVFKFVEQVKSYDCVSAS